MKLLENDWFKFVIKLLLITFISIISLLGAALYKYQNKLMYHPVPFDDKNNPKFCKSPSEYGIKNFEDKLIETSDGDFIHIFLLLQNNSSKVPTLIFSHGNAGNIGHWLENAVPKYARLGVNVLLYDYRGYGKSNGVPSEAKLNIDAETVLKYVTNHSNLQNDNVILFGVSLGGAVSVSLAHKHPALIKAIILENTFLSISKMVDTLMPQISVVKHIVLRIGWYSELKIPELSHPILFISGDSDSLVPPQHMKSLYDLAAKSTYKYFYSVGGGEHNNTNTIDPPNYYKNINKFIDHIFNNDNNIKNNQIHAPTLIDGKTNIPVMSRNFTIN